MDANTAYQMDSESGDAIITVDYENHPVKGKLTIYKKGEMLTLSLIHIWETVISFPGA